MTTTTTPSKIEDYSLTSVREAEGEGPVRFEAKLNFKGKPIAIVSNDGRGGCHRYVIIGYGTRQDLVDFEECAKEWNPDKNYTGGEHGDHLVYRLMNVATLNAKRRVVVLFDEENFYEDGRYNLTKSIPGMTYHAMWNGYRDHFSLPIYADRNVRIWNKKTSQFEAIPQATA